MYAIELFAGAGGMSLGLHNAGWEVSKAIEFDKWATETYRNNFTNTDLIHADVRDINFNHYSGIDLIAGGPPCQPFSVAGKQLANKDDRDMVPEFIRAVKEAKPRAFIMENVAGLLSKKHEYYLSKLLHQFSLLKYRVSVKILNAAYFGVPQQRKRVFFIGVNQDINYQFPAATHGLAIDLKPFITAGYALKDAPVDEKNNAIVTYAKNPILRPSPWAGMLVNGKGRPINLAEPSRTIPASAGGNRTHIIDEKGVLFEYHKYLQRGGKPRQGLVENVRRLTVRESARLQSFPDRFQFSGPRTQKYKQIGNAVPPLLGEVIGRSIFEALNPSQLTNTKVKPANIRGHQLLFN